MKKLWTSEAKKEKSNNLKRRDIELGELIKNVGNLLSTSSDSKYFVEYGKV